MQQFALQPDFIGHVLFTKRRNFHASVFLMPTILMCGQPIIHKYCDYMRINNDDVWRYGLLLSIKFWLVRTYNRREWMAKNVLFFWNMCWQIYCRIFWSPFATACGFSMMWHQTTSALLCAHTWMPRLGLYEFSVVNQFLGYPAIKIYRSWITFYGDTCRFIIMRLYLAKMRISLLAYPKLLLLLLG